MKLLYVLCAGLVGVLLAVPAPALAGPCGYSQTYYQPYVAPTYTQAYTPYVPPVKYVPVETFYQVGQATLNARLVQEAVDAAAAKTKAEFAAQAAAQVAAAKDEQNRLFQQQVLQLLSQHAALSPAAVDPEKEQLKADNAQMRATLQQIVEAQKAKPPAGPATGGTAPPLPPAPPTPGTPKVEAPAQGNPLASAKTVLMNCFKDRCASCHNGTDQKALGNPDAMPTERLADCVARMKSQDAKKRMPKTGDAVLAEQFFAAEDLLLARLSKPTTVATGN